jgi:hypothetical protein
VEERKPIRAAVAGEHTFSSGAMGRRVMPHMRGWLRPRPRPVDACVRACAAATPYTDPIAAHQDWLRLRGTTPGTVFVPLGGVVSSGWGPSRDHDRRLHGVRGGSRRGRMRDGPLRGQGEGRAQQHSRCRDHAQPADRRQRHGGSLRQDRCRSEGRAGQGCGGLAQKDGAGAQAQMHWQIRWSGTWCESTQARNRRAARAVFWGMCIWEFQVFV